MWKTALQFLNLAWLALLFTSCGESTRTPDYNPAVGPFDENGNYVEAWADNPPKKRWFKRNKNAKPEPKKESDWARQQRLKREHKEKLKKEKALASKKEKEAALQRAKERKKTSSTNARTRAEEQRRDKLQKIQLERERQRRIAEQKERNSKSAAKPKPKPKPQVKAKAKPRPKPKPIKVKPKYRYHRVKKTDTLWGLSKRYGTSISAIKKANSLRSNTIITGSTIKIPR